MASSDSWCSFDHLWKARGPAAVDNSFVCASWSWDHRISTVFFASALEGFSFASRSLLAPLSTFTNLVLRASAEVRAQRARSRWRKLVQSPLVSVTRGHGGPALVMCLRRSVMDATQLASGRAGMQRAMGDPGTQLNGEGTCDVVTTPDDVENFLGEHVANTLIIPPLLQSRYAPFGTHLLSLPACATPTPTHLGTPHTTQHTPHTTHHTPHTTHHTHYTLHTLHTHTSHTQTTRTRFFQVSDFITFRWWAICWPHHGSGWSQRISV